MDGQETDPPVHQCATKVLRQLEGERVVFSTDDAGRSDIHRQKKKKKEPQVLFCTTCKMNLKWIIDQNVKPKTIKLLTENIGESLCDFHVGKLFLIEYQKHKLLTKKSVNELYQY